MLNFVKNTFRVFVEVCLWFILIGGAIVGGVMGKNVGHTFLGVVFGVICGGVIDIIYGGFVAVFLAIEENTAHTLYILKKLRPKLSSDDSDDSFEVRTTTRPDNSSRWDSL